MLLNDLKQFQATVSIDRLGSGQGEVYQEQESQAETTGKCFLLEGDVTLLSCVFMHVHVCVCVCVCVISLCVQLLWCNLKSNKKFWKKMCLK